MLRDVSVYPAVSPGFHGHHAWFLPFLGKTTTVHPWFPSVGGVGGKTLSVSAAQVNSSLPESAWLVCSLSILREASALEQMLRNTAAVSQPGEPWPCLHYRQAWCQFILSSVHRLEDLSVCSLDLELL